MAGETYYSTGTASVGAGSTNVTGSGTAWVSNGVQAGDYFENNGLSVRIAAVLSNTSLTLARGWPGAALSSNNYEIRYTPAAGRVTAQLNTLIALLGGGNLQALSALELAADKLPFANGAGTMGLTNLSTFARSLLDDANADAALSTLGIGGLSLASARYTASGTFIVPADTKPTTLFRIALTGGGGGGMAGQAGNVMGAGGAGASTVFRWISGLTPGTAYTVTIGAGGVAGQTAAASGGAGGDTSINLSTLLRAGGGFGGSAGSGGGGGIGSSTGHDLITLGGDGGDSTNFSSTWVSAGSGGASFWGGGGRGGRGTGVTAGQIGKALGSGGGGGAASASTQQPGGNGASGVALIEWMART